MRTAIVSDIHGNLTAFEAVLRDLRQTAPDVIVHGGDLADGGARPAEVVDRVRAFGWHGVIGNADEMLVDPEALKAFKAQSSATPQSLFTAIEETAEATRALLGEARLAWLSALPGLHLHDHLALVHASPENCWRAPGPEAPDHELIGIYKPLGRPLVVYAHIHRAYIRRTPEMVIANTGSVSLSFDGDSRAAYLLVDESGPHIRRVEYDLACERRALAASGIPHADWILKMLTRGSFLMP